MKSNLKLLTALYLLSSNLFAQDLSVSGKILDADQKPLVFANILLKNIDSVLIKGTSTNENGEFRINSIEKGKYLLFASYMENTSETITISVLKDLDIGILQLHQKELELDEAVISYKKPSLEQKVDRLVFNIENTALSDSDIWDVLKRTPSVVIINNQLSIKGSSNVGVMINDKLVNIPQEDIINLLSGSSASNVETIEVITSPPAKYSAEGGLLINIKMKKNLIAGYNGSMYNKYTQGVYAKHTLGTEHFFKGKKSDFSITYSYRDDKYLSKYTDITNFFEPEERDEIWTAEQQSELWRKQHNISAFYDYEINDRNKISVSTINSLSPTMHRNYTSETLIIDANNNLDSSFGSVNTSDSHINNVSYYVDWTHTFKKEGSQISLSNHYTFYDYYQGQDIRTDFFDNNGTTTGVNDFLTTTGQETGLLSLQVDYESPFGEKAKLETGLRYAAINSENRITQEGFERNYPGVDPTPSGLFTYDEQISAAYISLNNNWENWKLKAGLRAEYAETIGKLDSDTDRNKNSYLEFFPSVSLRHSIGANHDIGLQYYRRIERPRYNRLNPFQYFQTNNSTIEGNPDLLPTTRNYISIGYTYDKGYTAELTYFEDKNDYALQVFQDNEANLLRFISSNIGLKKSYGLDVTINKRPMIFWNIYLLFGYYYSGNTFKDLSSGQLVKNEIWTGHMRTTNSFTLLRDESLFADLSFRYFSPTVSGNSRRESTSELSLSFRKNLWNKKASVSLSFEDIFNQSKTFTTRRYLNQNNSSSFRRENRLLVLGFRYKFGNIRISDNQKRKQIDERNRI
ncbi:TonB-dependent receptor domain-containing protein [Maribacter sp. CXY002]|uniref:TonB-dependent receptor domain-containing protein n=1 Tax=Maribacter luteocoastalis TaxID=3407671 RepID=UPI003B679D9A